MLHTDVIAGRAVSMQKDGLIPDEIKSLSCSVSTLLALHVPQEMLDVRGELLGVLQEREVTDLRLQQQAGIRDVRGHVLGVLSFDRLVMIGIDNPGRHGDAMEVLGRPVRLGFPHFRDLGEEGLVLAGRGRQRLVFFLRAGDEGVEHRTVGDVGDAARIRIGGEGEQL